MSLKKITNKKMRLKQFTSKMIDAQSHLCEQHKSFDNLDASTITHVGPIIKRIRQAKCIRQKELADRAGYDQGNLSRVERGEQGVSVDVLRRIAYVLGVQMSEFDQDAKPGVKITVSSHIPLIGWDDVPLSGENDSPSWGNVEVDQWIACPVPHGPRAFALVVSGESMKNDSGPLSFDHGDIIFVDPEREAVQKSLVVLRLSKDKTPLFKRILIDGSSTMMESLNPSWPNRISELPDSAALCGVVIAKLQKFI